MTSLHCLTKLNGTKLFSKYKIYLWRSKLISDHGKLANCDLSLANMQIKIHKRKKSIKSL